MKNKFLSFVSSLLVLGSASVGHAGYHYYKRVCKEFISHSANWVSEAAISVKQSVVGRQSMSTRFYPIGSNYEIANFSSFNEDIGWHHFSPDSKWFGALKGDGTLYLVNLKTLKKTVIKVPGHRIYSFDFGPDYSDFRNNPSEFLVLRVTDHKESACCSHHNSAQIWSLKDFKPKSDLIPTPGSHNTAYLVRDSNWLVAQSNDFYRIHRAHTGEANNVSVPRKVNFQSRGGYILTLPSASDDKKDFVYSYELLTGFRSEGVSVTGHIEASIANNNTVILSSLNDHGVPVVRDLRTLEPVGEALDGENIPFEVERIGATLSQDGSWAYGLYHTKSDSGGVFWDTETGLQVHRIQDADKQPWFSGKGQFAAISVGDALNYGGHTVYFSRKDTRVNTVPGRTYPYNRNSELLITVQKKSKKSWSFYFTDPHQRSTSVIDLPTDRIELSNDGMLLAYQSGGRVHVLALLGVFFNRAR